MSAIRQLILALWCAGLTACAHSGGVASTSGPARWTGSFKQSQMAATAVVGPAVPGRGAAYGTIALTPVEESTPARVRVELSISAPVPAGSQVAWAVFTGPCGSPSPPIAGPKEFPAIDIANSGGGTVRTVMALVLDPRVSYHANVYWAAQVSDVSNVMMCAMLSFAGPR